MTLAGDRRVRLAGAAAGLVVVIAGAAWWSGGPQAQGIGRMTGPGTGCPPAPQAPAPGDPRDASPGIPGLVATVGPTGATVCRYAGAGVRGLAPGAVRASVELDAARAAELAGVIDFPASGQAAVPVAQLGTLTAASPQRCRPEPADRVVIRFRYRTGSDVVVALDTGRCQVVSNGALAIPFRNDLVRELDWYLAQAGS